MTADELSDHIGNMECGAAAGFDLLYDCVSNRDDWDEFEGRILFNREAYAAAHPDDDEVQEEILGKRRWNSAQQRWGRDTMAQWNRTAPPSGASAVQFQHLVESIVRVLVDYPDAVKPKSLGLGYKTFSLAFRR